jgi:hypothetical protein
MKRQQEDPLYTALKRSSERFGIPVRIVETLCSLDHETKLRVADYITTNHAECVNSCAR